MRTGGKFVTIILSILAVAVIGTAVALWLVMQDIENAPTINEPDSSKQTTDDEDKTPAVEQKTESLTMYYVRIGDNGANGTKIGCDDSLVAVQTEPVTFTNKLDATMQRIVADKTQTYGDPELYNVLYQADLKYVSGSVAGDTATVKLTGILNLRGTCDNPRVVEQLEQAIKTATGAQKVVVMLNDKTLAEAISLK